MDWIFVGLAIVAVAVFFIWQSRGQEDVQQALAAAKVSASQMVATATQLAQAVASSEAAPSAAAVNVIPQAFIDRDDLCKWLGVNAYAGGVMLDGVLIHNGTWPVAEFVTTTGGLKAGAYVAPPVIPPPATAPPAQALGDV